MKMSTSKCSNSKWSYVVDHYDGDRSLLGGYTSSLMPNLVNNSNIYADIETEKREGRIELLLYIRININEW